MSLNATIVDDDETFAASAAPLPGVIAASDAMQLPVRTARRIASTDATVFLEGETGTGKEIFARAIHAISGSDGPFVAINCGAFPPDLLASQLFGHEKGSFTGALQRHAGVFEQATHGTLLLDEITEMPLELQVYLLRAIETGSVRRVGATREIATPTRILASANRDPHEAIAEGRLREDLYYRLADITIRLPPLRERGDDVVLLARAFIDQLNERHGRSRWLAPESLDGLRNHPWRGNVRELRSAVQRAFLLGSDERVVVVPEAVRESDPAGAEGRIGFRIGTTLAQMEQRMFVEVLAHCRGDRTATAKLLGVSLRTVHNRLARMRAEGIDADPG